MTAVASELVQVRHQKLKNINFSVMDIHKGERHEHSSLELGLVLSGTVRLEQGQTTRSVSVGELMLFNAYDSHELYSEQGAQVLFMQLAPSFGTAYFSRIASVNFDTSCIVRLEKEHYDSICSKLLTAALTFFEEPEAYGLECAAWAAGLITVLLRCIPYQLSTETEVMAKKKKIGRQQRISGFLEQHYPEKLTLEQLAKAEGISNTYMSRIFAELFHKPFQEYLSEFRLTKALPLLMNPSIYLVDICMECGFSDTRYLNAVCRKQYDCTALQLRARLIRGEFTPLEEGTAAIEAPRYSDGESLQILRSYINTMGSPGAE